MALITRKATIEDLPILLQFEQGVIDYERDFDPTLKEKDAIYYDLAAFIRADHVEVLVVEKDQQIIGSGYSRIEKATDYLKHDEYAYLGFMYVAPEFRGQGVNKLIMDGLFEWTKQQGVHEVRLDVYAENAGAIRAYEKVGFGSHLINMRMSLKD